LHRPAVALTVIPKGTEAVLTVAHSAIADLMMMGLGNGPKPAKLCV
jgi:hypothetical protein